jgi:PrtD family type I secretion system ABC transporter
MKNTAVRRFLFRGMADIGIISFVISILLLTQPIYMLQVYDRVLPSSSLNTLVFLSMITFAAVAVLGLLEVFRQLYASRLAVRLESELGATAFLAGSQSPNAEIGDTQPLRDLATVRNFVSSRILQSLFDLPFVPVFLLLLVYIHPYIFLLTLAGLVLVAIVAWANQRSVEDSGKKTAENAMKAMASAQAFTRSAETIRAMGMARNTVGIWGRAEADALRSVDETTSINAWYGGLSRSIRLLLQIGIMGMGAWLVVGGKMTPGMIFATSMVSGRALQPIDQLVAGWRQIFDARLAWERLQKAMARVETAMAPKTGLPEPIGEIHAENLIYVPQSRKAAEPLIKRLNFKIPAGSSVGLIGPSGAGKSTLARLICGAIEPSQGSICIDKADIRQWDRERLGKFIGYLSQEADLLPGTVAQNISRFAPDASDESIVAAAKKAQVHDMIIALPNGYGTLLGPGGMTLSGGQRQRIGLARAFYGTPRLLVLDEPNANLDAEGDAALERALQQAKSDRITVVMVTQRKASADKLDNLMIIRDGQIEDYGPREAVVEKQNAKLREFIQKQQAAAQSQVRTLPQLVQTNQDKLL